jgi:hypothetical protein
MKERTLEMRKLRRLTAVLNNAADLRDSGHPVEEIEKLMELRQRQIAKFRNLDCEELELRLRN